MRIPTPNRDLGSGARSREQQELQTRLQPRYAWRLRSAQPPQSISALLSALLQFRGVGESAAAAFLNPSYEATLQQSAVLPQCGPAVARIQRALKISEPIAIFGDYDVDGVTGAALLAEALTGLGGVVRVELPHREDGYGLSVSAVRRLVPPATLLITVDNGTSASAAVADALSRGADVIILDHHAVTGSLPPGALVVNPALPSAQYPEPFPAAVGVAWKLAAALFAAEGRAGDERFLLDLVALGTLADSVKLLGENRVLVRWGLEVLRRSRRPGLHALAERAGAALRDVTADTVTFRLVPRLNAAGRLRHANLALELLRTTHEGTAQRLASELDAVNEERRLLTEEIMAEVRRSLGEPFPPVVVASGPWPLGLLGVLAGRLAEEYQRPAVAVAVRDDECVASIRGPKQGPERDAGTNMVELVGEMKGLLTKYGGHAGAAGFSFPRSALGAVEDFFRAHAPVTPNGAQPELMLDCPLLLALVTPDLTRALNALEPFGNGNERPVFLFHGLSVAESRSIGTNGDHLRMVLRHPEHAMPGSAVAFRWGNRPRPPLGSRVDVAAEIRQDRFRGMLRVDLHVQDLRGAVAPAP
ncbi:MAG: single-stranded-DNA-specific exonuclease [Parcubacteria group bacterium Gr01-1014_38]|nr:MAG: single-stranded-DNA-specific exonuclease [Parcubacteria group bacterium Gr01-1014_38]